MDTKNLIAVIIVLVSFVVLVTLMIRMIRTIITEDVAMRAQKKWEKMQEIKKSDLDDPKKDYSGYRIKDPTHPRALRNLKPTDDPKELQKRQIRMQLEKAMKRAPTNWYDQLAWNIIPVGNRVYDQKTNRYYVISAVPDKLIPDKTDKTNKENEPRQVQTTEYVASAAPEAAVWVVSLALLLRLLLAVI